MFRTKNLKELLAVPSHIFSHIAIIAVSAAIALSLPHTVGYIAQKFLIYWAFIGNEKIFMLSVEILTAVALIFIFNYIAWIWRERRHAVIAREAGLVACSSSRGVFARKKNRKLKEDQGISRDIMVIGSTGHRTFANSNGELHNVIKNCREARIMLLNPYSEGADIRAKSITDSEITQSRLAEQIRESIAFLKELRSLQKNIRLKLYASVPFLKMTISGDYIWAKHYHAGFDVIGMPEYIFRHIQRPGSLYGIFYQYFMNQWNNPEIPEYDFETDQLVYRDTFGNELKRKGLWGPDAAGVFEEISAGRLT